MAGWRTNRRTGTKFRTPNVDKNVIDFANRHADMGWIFRHADPQEDGTVMETWVMDGAVLYMRYNPNSNKILSVTVT